MKLLILILLFPFITQGQIVRTNPYYKPFAAACTPLLLDTYSGAAAAYSLRKLDCDYAGSAIRVRRSSDNTESDIGFTSGGDLDTAALKTFIGTGGTDDGFVVTWYDQSGNSRNATMSTSTQQPLVMDNGVVLRLSGLPTVIFDGSNDRLEFSRIDLTAGTLFATTRRTGSNTFQTFFYITQSSTGRSAFETGLNNNATYGPVIVGSNGNSSFYAKGGTLRDNEDRILTTIWLGTGTSGATHYSAYDDNSSITLSNSGNVGASSGSVSFIGCGISLSSITNFYGGWISELIFYGADKSSDRSNINSNINNYWGIY